MPSTYCCSGSQSHAVLAAGAASCTYGLQRPQPPWPAPFRYWLPPRASAHRPCPHTGPTACISPARHLRRLRHGHSRIFTHASLTQDPGATPPAVQQEDSTVYSLAQTQVLVETAMLAAVGGLAYLMSTLLKLETSLGYFLPLPVVLAAMRGGSGAGWRTMMATGFLLVVLLGPLRAVSYVLIHGLLSASLGSLWKQQANFWWAVFVGAVVRMAGQLAYVVLSSATLGENLFAVMMANIYNLLDNVCASVGMYGAPPPVAIGSTLFALLLVNSLCYVLLLQVVYRVLLQSMGYKLGPLPGIIRKYLYAGIPDPDAAAARMGQ